MESTDSQIERPRTPIEASGSSDEKKADGNEKTESLLINDVVVDDDGGHEIGTDGSVDDGDFGEVEHACPFCPRQFETASRLHCHLHKTHRKSELIDEFLAAVDCTVSGHGGREHRSGERTRHDSLIQR